jgi:hypothetical protein
MATITSRPGAPVDPSDRAHPGRVLRVFQLAGAELDVYDHADGVVSVFVHLGYACHRVGDISGREAAAFVAWLRAVEAAPCAG